MSRRLAAVVVALIDRGEKQLEVSLVLEARP
jgi:hypothetical protein